MRNISFSINSWLFGTASIESICREAKKVGADGIDISGEPDSLVISDVKKALERYSLTPFCINGNFTDENRCICHSDPSCRKTAVEYGKRLVDMAVGLGCNKVLVVPSQVDKQTYFISREVDWNHAVDSLRELVAYAKSKGNVVIVLECVNKYEVALVHSLREGIAMCKAVGGDNIGIVGDTFHMQLEEIDGIPAAIREGGRWLQHVHLGDNTREVPGKGCMDWREFFIALDDIGYDQAISFEPVPLHLTGAQIFAGELSVNTLVTDLQWSHSYLKTMMQGIRN